MRHGLSPPHICLTENQKCGCQSHWEFADVEGKKKKQTKTKKNQPQYVLGFQHLLNLHKNEAVYTTMRNNGHKQRHYHKRYPPGLMRLSL